MSKKCTPLWREARFQVKMYKAPPVRITFGSWDVEKVHAVVARSTFPSENAQNASCCLTLRSHKSLEKHSVSRLSYLFAHLDLLSSETFSFVIFFLLLFSSLTLPISAFHLSILSEVWLLNFLRLCEHLWTTHIECRWRLFWLHSNFDTLPRYVAIDHRRYSLCSMARLVHNLFDCRCKSQMLSV